MTGNELLIVFDRAHGININGKQSPDGKHKEWLWSNLLCNELHHECKSRGWNSIIYPESATVPTYKDKKGIDHEYLSRRVTMYNNLPGKYKLVISLHNDADGSCEWTKQTGWSMWTSKGEDFSDKIAEKYLYPVMLTYFPELKHRRYFAKGLDNEANFTIFQAKCPVVLLEWLFQNNREDVEKLKDTEFLKRALIHFVARVHEDFNMLKKEWET